MKQYVCSVKKLKLLILLITALNRELIDVEKRSICISLFNLNTWSLKDQPCIYKGAFEYFEKIMADNIFKGKASMKNCTWYMPVDIICCILLNVQWQMSCTHAGQVSRESIGDK